MAPLARLVAVEEHVASAGVLAATRESDVPEERRAYLERAEALALDLGEGRLAAMDEGGIDVAVLMHAAGLENLEPELAIGLAAASNDELAAGCAAHPTRLVGLAQLPMTDPDAAADELRRAVGELGLRGCVINGASNLRSPDDPFFEPILAAAAELDAPIYLHPAMPRPAVAEAYYSGFTPAIDASFRGPSWGWHIETGVHALRMVLAGVFDRHPRLQVVIGHMGEAIPFMLDRWSDTLSRATASTLERAPKDYVLSNFHVSTSGFTTPAPLRCAIDVLGADRLMFAADYPYGIPSRQAVDAFAAIELEPDVRAKIAHENADRLFRIPR